MKLAIELLVLGAVQGALYALGALGMIVVYKSSGVLNLAHGAVGVAGMFVFAELRQSEGWSLVPAMVAGVGIAALLGYLTYLVAVRAIVRGAALVRVIATLAVLVIVQAALALRYGEVTVSTAAYLPDSRVSLLAGATVGADRLILFAIACVLTFALATVYRRTKFGLATTAVAENSESLAALGWSVGRISGVNWAIGGALSGLALILLAPLIGANVVLVFSFLLPVLAAAMTGGMSSFGLALLGGVIIGVLQAEIGAHAGTLVSLPDAVPFFAIVLLLMARGRGLPLRSYVGERLPKVGTGRLHPVGIVAVVVLLLFVINDVSHDWLSALTVSLTTSILVLSLVVVVGYCGQLSMAQAALAGCAAMAAAKMVADHAAPYWLAMVVGVVVSVMVGLAVGIPALRTRGVTLGVATLALSVAIDALVFNNTHLNTGFGVDVTDSGTRSFTLFGIDLNPVTNPHRYAALVAGVLLILMVLVANLRRGRVGRRFIAIRNNERAAAALGVNARAVKMWAFAYGGAIAGIGGVLMAFMNGTVIFDNYSAVSGLNAVSFAIVGGVGSVVGAVLGGTMASGGLGTELLDLISSGWATYIFLVGGVVLLAIVIGNPDGQAIVIADQLKGIRDRVRRVTGRAGDVAAPPASLMASAPVNGGRQLKPAEPHVLDIDGLTVRFGGIVALRDVSFGVGGGEVLAIVGPNGAGKTTLIDALTGFVKAARGSIALDGRNVTRLPPYRRAQAGLGRSFQSLELFEDLTVAENLMVAQDGYETAAYFRDLVHPQRKAASEDLEIVLETLGLSASRDSLPSGLGYGQRRLLAVGRAVVALPGILFLDEPCAGLDAHERNEVTLLIRKLVEQTGMSVVLVEHDVDVVRRVADRVIALDFGEVIASGQPDAVFQDAKVQAAYLGSNHTTADVLLTAEVVD